MPQVKKGKGITKKPATDQLEKRIRGLTAQAKGLRFEKQVGEYMSKQGYKVKYEKPIKYKFDVFGEKEDPLLAGKEYLIAECKDKSKVAPSDVLRFMSKLSRFYKELPEGLGGKSPVKALFAYTGELPRDARAAAKGFKPAITFRKFG